MRTLLEPRQRQTWTILPLRHVVRDCQERHRDDRRDSFARLARFWSRRGRRGRRSSGALPDPASPVPHRADGGCWDCAFIRRPVSRAYRSFTAPMSKGSSGSKRDQVPLSFDLRRPSSSGSQRSREMRVRFQRSRPTPPAPDEAKAAVASASPMSVTTAARKLAADALIAARISRIAWPAIRPTRRQTRRRRRRRAETPRSEADCRRLAGPRARIGHGTADGIRPWAAGSR